MNRIRMKIGAQINQPNKNVRIKDIFDLPSEDTMNIKDLDYDYLKENKEELINQWTEAFAQ